RRTAISGSTCRWAPRPATRPPPQVVQQRMHGKRRRRAAGSPWGATLRWSCRAISTTSRWRGTLRDDAAGATRVALRDRRCRRAAATHAATTHGRCAEPRDLAPHPGGAAEAEPDPAVAALQLATAP